MFTPSGYTLIRADGTRHNRIRGDLIPRRSLVIVQDGRHFVKMNATDSEGFQVYREAHRTHTYRSSGE